MKKKEKAKDKQSLSHVVKNTFYMLKIAFELCPELPIVQMAENVIYAVLNFLTGTLLLRTIINGFQTGRDFREIMGWMLLAYGAELVISLVMQAYYTIRYPVLRMRMVEKLCTRTYRINAALDLACYEDMAFFDKYTKASYEFIIRLDGVMNSMQDLLWCVVSMSLYSFYLLTVDPWLILFAVSPAVFGFFLRKASNKVEHEGNMKMQEEGRQRSYTQRTFYMKEFAKEMRMTGVRNVMLRRFEESTKVMMGYIKKYGWKKAILYFLQEEIKSVISVMGAILYAIFRTMVSGTMLVGDCLVIINSIENLTWQISYMAEGTLEFHKHSLYTDTIREYLEFENKIKAGEEDAPEAGDLSFRDVSFRYIGQEKDVLKHISFDIKKGEKIALVGQNGAGKSTLVKLMMRLYDPTEGEIRYDGKALSTYKLRGREGYRQRFSVVFQDFQLFSMTVAENILMRRLREGDDVIVQNAIRSSGLEKKVASFEKGAETNLTKEFDEKGEILSGGEGQKVAIARAFAKESSIMILDEPSSALDPIAEYEMYQNMLKEAEGKTMVFISHRMSSAVLADRIIFLENGEITETGSHAELMAKNGRYAELFRIQAQNYVEEGAE